MTEKESETINNKKRKIELDRSGKEKLSVRRPICVDEVIVEPDSDDGLDSDMVVGTEDGMKKGKRRRITHFSDIEALDVAREWVIQLGAGANKKETLFWDGVCNKLQNDGFEKSCRVNLFAFEEDEEGLSTLSIHQGSSGTTLYNIMKICTTNRLDCIRLIYYEDRDI